MRLLEICTKRKKKRRIKGINKVSIEDIIDVSEGDKGFKIEYRCKNNECLVYINEETAETLTESETIGLLTRHLKKLTEDFDNKSIMMNSTIIKNNKK